MRPRLWFEIFVAAAVAGTTGCIPQSEPLEYGRTRSPNGLLEAYVYELAQPNGGITQIMINFSPVCGVGSVSTDGLKLKLELRWIDDENLMVIHPPGVELEHNASGEVLQCRDKKVRVHLASRTDAATATQ